MPAEIGPGTPLICINAKPTHPPLPEHMPFALTEGAIYFCDGLHTEAKEQLCVICGQLGPGIFLRGKPRQFGAYTVSYCRCRFRPLNDGDTSLVKAANEQRQREKMLRHAENYSADPTLIRKLKELT